MGGMFLPPVHGFGIRLAQSEVDAGHVSVLVFQGATMTTDQRVLKLWAGGYGSAQIAERLGITVAHVKLILSSLDELQTGVFRAAA